MRRKIELIFILVLIIGIIGEYLIYKSVLREVEEVKVVFKESRDEYELKTTEKELETFSKKRFGYGDILDILSKNLSVRITKFTKSEDMKDHIIVQMEVDSSEDEFNRIVSLICEMENFYEMRKLSVKNIDKSQMNIIIDADFIIN